MLSEVEGRILRLDQNSEREVRQQRGPSELELYLCGRQDKKAKEMSRSLALLLSVRSDRQEDLGWALTTKVLIRGQIVRRWCRVPKLQ